LLFPLTANHEEIENNTRIEEDMKSEYACRIISDLSVIVRVSILRNINAPAIMVALI
jgi:hypothetical protein